MPRNKIGKQRSYRVSDPDYERFKLFCEGKTDISGAIRVGMSLVMKEAALDRLLKNKRLKKEAKVLFQLCTSLPSSFCYSIKSFKPLEHFIILILSCIIHLSSQILENPTVSYLVSFL